MAPVSALLVMLRKLAKSSRPAALLVRAQVDTLDFAGVPFGFVDQDVEFAGNGVEADQVAGTDFGDVAAHQASGVMWMEAGTLPDAPDIRPVGQQCHFEAAILQDAQRRGQFVQLGHTVGARALIADAQTKSRSNSPALKCGQYFALVVEHDGRCFDNTAAFAHGRHFNHAATDVAFHQAQAAVRGERVVGFAQDVFIAAGFRGFAPFKFAVDEERLFGVVAHTVSDDGIDIVVQQACVQQFADDERQAAGSGKVVHIGFTVWIHTDQQWMIEEISSKSSQFKITPAARAMATRCMVWLVEPPVAIRPIRALMKDFSVNISPNGLMVPFLMPRARCPAA